MAIGRLWYFAVFLGGALCLPLAPSTGKAGEATDALSVSGLVTDSAGQPLSGVVVFAADAETDRVVTMATSDEGGRLVLSVPSRRHNFGVLSSTVGVVQLTRRGSQAFTLVVKPLPALIANPDADLAAKEVGIAAGHAFILRGRIVDEAGGGLQGIRIEAVRPSGAQAAVAISGAEGRFAVAIPGGETRLRATAAGLRTVGSVRQGERLIVVMAIAADPDQVLVVEGHVLRFDLSDSVDPEYSPPPPVRAWLLSAYGICPAHEPLKVHEKKALKPYWYLDVLRREPPNPSSLDPARCTPPSIYDQAPPGATAGFGPLPGFAPPPPRWSPKLDSDSSP